MKPKHLALIVALIALVGALCYAQAPDEGGETGEGTEATAGEPTPAGDTGGTDATPPAGAEKLKDEALDVLIDSGDRGEGKAPSTSSGSTSADSASASAKSGTRRREGSSSSRSSSTRRSSAPRSEGAVPVVPSSPTETVTIRRDRSDRTETDREPAAAPRAAADTEPSEASNVLVPEPTDLEVPSPAPLDTGTPGMAPAGPMDSAATNAAMPGAQNAVPPTDAGGARSPASAILVGVLILAAMLVAAAVIVTVLNARRPAEDGTPRPQLAPAVPQFAHLSAPGVPEIALEQVPFVMGSSPSCDLRLADPKASPQHAEIDRTDEGWVLTDLGSISGTYLNGERISSPVLLRAGDELRMGDIVVTFETDD